jgi:hypothetical protein
MIYRIFVEKKDNVQARKEAADIKTLLNIDAEDLRLVLRYDVEGLSESELNASLGTVFSEPPVDNVYLETLEIPENYKAFAVSCSSVTPFTRYTLAHFTIGRDFLVKSCTHCAAESARWSYCPVK